MVEDLKTKILNEKEKGRRPFFVSAVSGSEMFGAFDQLSDIADVCAKHNLWLHVDVRQPCLQEQPLETYFLKTSLWKYIFLN